MRSAPMARALSQWYSIYMRYLGIDYGARWIGIAVSDDEGAIAFPKTNIEARTDTVRIREIKKIIKIENIGCIVVGLPIHMNGREGLSAARTRAFASKIQKSFGLPIFFENELLTSRIATHAHGSHARVDAQAAALILQSYLDRLQA